jgi:hypothetical protein
MSNCIFFSLEMGSKGLAPCCGAMNFLCGIANGNRKIFGENLSKNSGFKGASPCPITEFTRGQFCMF